MNTATATAAQTALHTDHLAQLAAGHHNTLRLTMKQSSAWDDDSVTRNTFIARAQRRANRDNATWFVVSRASILLATVNPIVPVTVEDDSDEVCDFGACI